MIWGTFLFFAGLTFLLTLWVHFFMPETHHVPLERIPDVMAGGRPELHQPAITNVLQFLLLSLQGPWWQGMFSHRRATRHCTLCKRSAKHCTRASPSHSS